MRLYLVRHCDAVHPLEDAERPLSPRGRDQAARLADWLPRIVGHVDQVWHSGVLRARQTAETLAGALPDAPPVVQHDGFTPGDSANHAADLVRHEDRALMVVTHLPLVARVAALLLTGRRDVEPLVFHTGSVAYLHGDSGAYVLDWLVHADVLPTARAPRATDSPAQRA